MNDILLGLSGGVDSAAAAALLKEQGFTVTACFLLLTDDSIKEEENARALAKHLGIKLITADFRERFRENVSGYFIKEYLSGGLFLDGGAARELYNRGFGKYIGVSVGENIAKGYLGYDLGAREVIKPPFDGFSRGKNMPIAHMYAPKGNGKLLELAVTDSKTEVISEAYTFDRNFISAAMTRFENSLGGRVVVMGMTVKGNMSQSLFNYRRMRLIEELIKWCGGDVPIVRGEPNVHLIFNRAREGEDFTHLLTAINLGDDALDSISVYLPEDMRKKRIFHLAEDGEWKETDYVITGDAAEIKLKADTCEPIYLLFE